MNTFNPFTLPEDAGDSRDPLVEIDSVRQLLQNKEVELRGIIDSVDAKISKPGIRGGFNVDDVKSYGSIQKAIASIPYGQAKTLYITEPQYITADLDIPTLAPNLSIVVLRGGSFSGAHTVTFGPFECGLFPCFASTVTVVFGLSQNVSVEWFGAAVGGSTESGLAIQAAVNSVLVVGGDVILQDGSYKVSTQIYIHTETNQKVIGLRGTSMWSTLIDYYGTTSPALKIGTSGGSLDNSGFVNCSNFQVLGTNSTGEVDGIHGRKGQRYSHWDNVMARGFAKGVGITLENYWLIGWGNLYSLSNYQAVYATVMNAVDIASIHIEGCGPHSSYTHSTLVTTDPSCYIQGQGTNINTVSIEANLAINTLRIEDEIIIGNYYSESNYAPATGNEVSLRGESPEIRAAMIYPGTYGAPPNPRYILGMGDSVNARVSHFEVRHTAPNPTNTTYGVDYETSYNSIVDFVFQSYAGGISQAAAYTQYVKWNNNVCTLNGVRMVAGMPFDKVGRILLEGYSALPVEHELMQRIGSSGNALGMTAYNLTAGSGMKQFPGPLGHGRVQSVAPLAVTACGVYYANVAGTFNITSKYFISSYVHKTVSAASAQLRVLNGADDQIISSNTPTFVGWNRISLVKTWPNAVTNAFDIWPIYASSNIGTGYAGGFCIIDLTAFDTAYGTSIATLPTSILEEIIDFSLLSDRFREYVRSVAPVDGTYKIGDVVWNYPTALNAYAGFVCTADGTPGTWKGFGVVSSGISGTGNEILSADPTFEGTITAVTLNLSGAATSNLAGGSVFNALNATNTTETRFNVENTNGRSRFGVLTSGAAFAGSVTAAADFQLWAGNALKAQVYATGGIGYATGAGGTVTQATSKATGVTLSNVCGEITMNNAALLTGVSVSFTLTNSVIAATDFLMLKNQSGGTPGAYTFDYQCAAGSAVITVTNRTIGTLSEAIVLGFAVFKGVIT